MSGLGTVVAGYDGTEGGRDAIVLAARLAGTSGGRLIVVHVIPALHAGLRDEAAAEIAALEPDAEAAVVAAPSPAAGLRRLAERERADLIVVGSTGRSRVGRVLLGSTGRQLLHGSPCAVAAAPRAYAQGPQGVRVIGAGFDMSPESRVAVRCAAALADLQGARLAIVAVVPRAARHFADASAGGEFAGPAASPRARLQAALEHERKMLPARVHAEGRLLEGNPADELIAEADGGIDLLFLGSRGYGALGRVIAGSVAASVLDAAPCPVVVVPRRVGAAPPVPDLPARPSRR